MKTPQRRFVVEFKSGRRLPKSGGNSIWGDTDLKALAREVEDQSSHLFGAGKASVQDVREPAPGTNASIPASELAVEDVAPEPPTNPISAGSLGSVSAVTDEVPGPAPTAIEPAAVFKTVKALKKAPQKRVARVLPAPVPSAKAVPPARAVTAATTSDDLATLDAENKRLRHLLANKLRAQNAELKRMLERF
ncbi:hypothetical protein [Ensifer adhaerens]|uniref:hypothetical protein n=1 Tax=Ensifer adhaerens TaxID=106592 RepID=UPI001319D107|nr:hypothetical protein [Ensifer adhaerens]